MKKLAIAASITAMALAGVAIAAAPEARGPSADRTTTRAEALERANAMFERVDVNKDGKLDDGDREARRAAVFDRIDTNKDGSISRAEFAAMRPPMGGMGRRGEGHEGGPGMGGEHPGMGGHGMRAGHGMRGGMMMMRMADSDRDGAVSKAEFTAAASARFDRADSNHDGQITPAERQAARAAMRERMHEAMQHQGQPPKTPVN